MILGRHDEVQITDAIALKTVHTRLMIVLIVSFFIPL